MKLTEIKIENFRSIKSQTIVIEDNCQILIGRNEAGKSNILKAIAAVFGMYTVSDKDKRKKIGNETINRYYVYARIELSENDFNEILNRFSIKYSNIEVILFKNKKTLFDLIKSVFNIFLIWIDIADQYIPHFSYWTYNENDFELENEIYLNKTTFYIDKQEGKQDINEIFNLIFETVKNYYLESPYRCHYWQHSDSFLLPSSIAIDNFITKPENCKPLRNIFIVCNRHKIRNEFTNALSQDGDYSNLLDQVSNQITKIFQSIWKDFKNTTIELVHTGSEIKIKVANKNKYSFEDRSDGFKKFISILLMLSTEVRSKQIGERDIILIDEPDQSLYPTSAEYLRDELLQISKTAKVIYATHSPYMIDSSCIERHLIIEKRDDITQINKQDQNAEFYDDELLRRAIGSSIFEIIKQKNIIFEGWLDKELYCKYQEYNKKSQENNQIGMVYLRGISNVETLVQLLILANKKFVIVADSDEVSEKKRKEFEENYEEYKSSWLAYGDVISEVLTMEDFISIEKISAHIKEEIPSFIYNASISALENINNGVNNDKEKKQKIKKNIIKELCKKDINEKYSIFFEKLRTKVEDM